MKKSSAFLGVLRIYPKLESPYYTSEEYTTNRGNNRGKKKTSKKKSPAKAKSRKRKLEKTEETKRVSVFDLASASIRLVNNIECLTLISLRKLKL